MIAPAEAGAALGVLVAGALLARATLTDARAVVAAALASALFAAMLVVLLDARGVAAAALLLATLLLRARTRTAVAASALTPLLAWVDPAAAVSAVAAAAWNAPRRYVVAIECVVVTVVIVVAHDVALLKAILLPSTAAALGWLAFSRVPRGAGLPSTHAVRLALLAGAGMGLLGLLAVDRRGDLLPAGATGLALLAGAAGAVGGAVAALVPLGIAALLAVRDDARAIVLASAVGALFAGLAQPDALVLALAPVLILGGGAGAACVLADGSRLLAWGQRRDPPAKANFIYPR